MTVGLLAVVASILNWQGYRTVFATITAAAVVVMIGLVVTGLVLRQRQGRNA